MGETIETVLRRPVIPVLTIDDPERGVRLAEALIAGGLDVLEVTLRTSAALEAVRRIVARCPGALVGVGTLIRPEQIASALAAGASFAVSPGVSPALMAAFECRPMPWLPAAATVSESMALLERGWCYQKLFPARALGGLDYLDAIRAPLPEVAYCPTGGLDAQNAPAFLARANVACVGGSWVAPSQAVRTRAWQIITELAASASRLERTWTPAGANR